MAWSLTARASSTYSPPGVSSIGNTPIGSLCQDERCDFVDLRQAEDGQLRAGKRLGHISRDAEYRGIDRVQAWLAHRRPPDFELGNAVALESFDQDEIARRQAIDCFRERALGPAAEPRD